MFEFRKMKQKGETTYLSKSFFLKKNYLAFLTWIQTYMNDLWSLKVKWNEEI